MVTTIKSWTVTPNHPLQSPTDALRQYQEVILELKNQFVAAGWTVTWSSDGSTHSASDLWVDNTDIVIATANTTPHSMIILRAPTGWGDPSDSAQYHIFIECIDGSSATLPNNFGFFLNPGLITHNAITGRPTIPTGAINGTSSVPFILNLPAANTEYRASYWRTGATAGVHVGGDVFVFTRRATDTYFTGSFAVIDPIYARGKNRALVYWHTTALTNWFSVIPNGSATDLSGVTQTIANITPATSTGNWVAGVDAAGDRAFFPIFPTNNQASFQARYYGHLPDIWSFSADYTEQFNFTDSADTDLVRLRGFNGIAIPVLSATPAL